jgi:hypothetical protein
VRFTRHPLQVPELRLHEQVIKGLQSLVDGFVAPALLVSNISLPLFQPPKGLNMPVLVMSGNQSAAVSQILPRLTALPTFVLPQSFSFQVPKIDLPTVSEGGCRASCVLSLPQQLLPRGVCL